MQRQPVSRDMLYAVIALVALTATSLMAQTATYPNLVPWHAGLAKPSFNPPNWVFGPVWTALHVLMALALWRILRSQEPGRNTALGWFAAMLVLNASWSWMFFAAQSPLLGLINIVPQLAVILATIAAAWRIDRFAAVTLMPLAAWVSFAAVLNAAIWQLN